MEPLDIIHKVIEIAHSNIELTSRISAILSFLEREFHGSSIGIYVLESDRRLHLKYITQRSKPHSMLLDLSPIIGEGVIGSVAQKREATYYTIRDVPRRLGFLTRWELDELICLYRTFAFIPLCDERDCYGVLFLLSPSPSFSDPEKRLLHLVSKELMGLLKIIDLYTESKKRITELMTISEIGRVLLSNKDLDEILKDLSLIIAKTIGAKWVRIILKERDLKGQSRTGSYGELPEEIKKHIEKDEETIFAHKETTFQRIARNYVILISPILVKEKVLGAITVLMGSDKEDLTMDNGLYIVDTISGYLSSGIENILLRSQLREILEELNIAHKRLMEQEKLKSLGEMTASIAHEIRNPLVVIGGFAKRLAKRVDLGYQERRYLSIILKEVGRLESILKDILNYVKEVPLNREVVNLDDIITELIQFFKSDPLWGNIEFIKECDPILLPTYCDPQQMKQVFINIFMNAYEAMNGVGRITIRLFNTEAKDSEFVAVSISDTGGGIDPLVIENIFNPFFTTKREGTGLGLAISNKIVLSHKGRIEVQNQIGVGATFTVYLPAHTSSTISSENDKIEKLGEG